LEGVHNFKKIHKQIPPLPPHDLCELWIEKTMECSNLLIYEVTNRVVLTTTVLTTIQHDIDIPILSFC